MIAKSEILMGRDTEYASDYTQEISDNIDKLLEPMNKVREAWAKPMKVNSGWRPPSVNASTPGAATHSKHMEGLACDIADPDGALMEWVLANLDLMQQLNLYFENFDWTPNWVHFQLGGPGSGKRIYVPNANRPTSPGRWSGHYDSKYDQ
jgi:hypothetical protein